MPYAAQRCAGDGKEPDFCGGPSAIQDFYLVTVYFLKTVSEIQADAVVTAEFCTRNGD